MKISVNAKNKIKMNKTTLFFIFCLSFSLNGISQTKTKQIFILRDVSKDHDTSINNLCNDLNNFYYTLDGSEGVNWFYHYPLGLQQFSYQPDTVYDKVFKEKVIKMREILMKHVSNLYFKLKLDSQRNVLQIIDLSAKNYPPSDLMSFNSDTLKPQLSIDGYTKRLRNLKVFIGRRDISFVSPISESVNSFELIETFEADHSSYERIYLIGKKDLLIYSYTLKVKRNGFHGQSKSWETTCYNLYARIYLNN